MTITLLRLSLTSAQGISTTRTPSNLSVLMGATGHAVYQECDRARVVLSALTVSPPVARSRASGRALPGTFNTRARFASTVGGA